MKTYRPSWAAWACFHVGATLWTTATAAVAFSLFELHLMELHQGGGRFQIREAEGCQMIVTSIVVVVGLLISISGMLRYPRSRYEIGATDITVHDAGIIHATRAFPLLEFTGIAVHAGPLQRLFGVAHVILYRKDALSVRLLGLADAEDARRFIEERRARLRETAPDA